MAPYVCQQTIGDAVLGRKGGEGLDRIVADREQRDASRFQLPGNPLQLDELRLAERSPPGAAVEHHDRGTAGPGAVEIDRFAGLVRQADIGEPCADGRTDVGVVARARLGHEVSPHVWRCHAPNALSLAVGNDPGFGCMPA